MSAPSRHRIRRLGPIEFTAFLAMSMALAALGIDLMLPAFAEIRTDLGLSAGSTALAGLVTTYFIGLAIGTVVYGPVSDRVGRRPMLAAGYVVYAAGALASALAPSLAWLLVARFVWGFGAAGPRTVTLAVVRDTYSGERMSRAMSLIMAVFIVVPVIAPTIGAAATTVMSWRWLFASVLVATAAVAVWGRRLPETLADEHRRELTVRELTEAVRIVVADRVTVGMTLALTALYGGFVAYLGTAELIFGDVFGAAQRFPVLFGGLAAAMGSAMLLNARIVRRVGTRRLAHTVLVVYLVVASALLATSLATLGVPPLWAFMALGACLLACHALLIPNLNTIAMEAMGRVAGTAAAVIGAIQIAFGALLASLTSRAFDGTVTPLAIGFLAAGVVAAALTVWAERGRLFPPLSRPASPQAITGHGPSGR